MKSLKQSFLEALTKATEVKMPKKDFIAEHKKLVQVLELPSHEDDLEEAKDQAKELKEEIKKSPEIKFIDDPKKSPKGHYSPGTEEVTVIGADGETDTAEDQKPKKKLKKSFIDALAKGGEGSGVKGHTTARQEYPKRPESPYDPADPRKNRTPMPGEGQSPDSPKPDSKKESTFIPAEGFEVHPSDAPPLKAYKNLVSYFKKEGMDFQGHITLDPASGKIRSISPQGEKAIEYVKSVIAGKPGEKPIQGSIDYSAPGMKPEKKPEGGTIDYKQMNQIQRKPEGPSLDYGGKKPKKA